MLFPRAPRDLQPNRLTQAVDRARARGRSLIDLTLTNPTRAGLHYPRSVLAMLGSPDAIVYEPVPFGLERARRAVATDYSRRGIAVDPARIVLTASTSEAYSLLFKLLCASTGHDVLVPVPSYPLFDHLTELDGVTATPYRLEYHGRWCVDLAHVDRQWSDATRAALAVSPNNPTSSILSSAELQALASRCAERQAALIVDEVFADYPLDDREAVALTAPASAIGVDGPLTFFLGGLSKSAGLPQVKLGWMRVDGPEPLVGQALERLELICDTYLSVGTPVQIAASSLIESGAAIRDEILARVRTNYAALREAAASHPAIEILHAQAGWSAVIRTPATRREEDLVLDLIDRDGVLVYPGYFFDFAHESFLVVSLLPETDVFADGIGRVMERADG
jgi:alanine-synthesizing transaminase